MSDTSAPITPAPVTAPSPALTIVAFVLSIAAILAVDLALGILGAILGGVALHRGGGLRGTNLRGWAIAAIVIGTLAALAGFGNLSAAIESGS